MTRSPATTRRARSSIASGTFRLRDLQITAVENAKTEASLNLPMFRITGSYFNEYHVPAATIALAVAAARVSHGTSPSPFTGNSKTVYEKYGVAIFSDDMGESVYIQEVA